MIGTARFTFPLTGSRRVKMALNNAERAICRALNVGEGDYERERERVKETEDRRREPFDADRLRRQTSPYPTAMRMVAADESDIGEEEDVENLVRRAQNHLSEFLDNGDDDVGDDRLIRAAKCLLTVIEARHSADSVTAVASRRPVVRFARL